MRWPLRGSGSLLVGCGSVPEGDTVWRTARRLGEVFSGRELVRTELRWPGLSTVDLSGRSTVSVEAVGKHLLHRVAPADGDSGWTVHSHLRMDGYWRIHRTDVAPQLTHYAIRAVLATPDYVVAGWHLGMLDLVRTPDEHTLVGHLGPDILATEFTSEDLATAVANLKAAPATIAAALLDQTNLAGLGTIWTAESLFSQRLNPWTAASSLSVDELEALISRARKLMQRSCQLPPGRESTNVHGRHHKPCVRCGTLIALGRVGPPTQERVIYHCPRCQPVVESRDPAPRAE